MGNEIKNARNRERKQWLKDNGYCVDCGSELAELGRTRCSDCLEKNRIKKKQFRETHPDKIRIDIRERYQQMKEKGICGYCQIKKATPGYSTCEYCRAKLRNKKQERDRAKGTMPRQMFGWEEFCSICGKPKENNDHKVCDKCYDRLVKQCEINNSKPRSEAQIKAREFYKQFNQKIYSKKESRA